MRLRIRTDALKGATSPAGTARFGRLRLSGAADLRSFPPSARFASRMGLLLFRPSGAFPREIRKLRAPKGLLGKRHSCRLAESLKRKFP